MILLEGDTLVLAFAKARPDKNGHGATTAHGFLPPINGGIEPTAHGFLGPINNRTVLVFGPSPKRGMVDASKRILVLMVQHPPRSPRGLFPPRGDSMLGGKQTEFFVTQSRPPVVFGVH
jgi:hypothetical protein